MLCATLTSRTTSWSLILSNYLANFIILSVVRFYSLKKTVMHGVLMFVGVVIKISLSRGIPSVILAAPWPAKWNVFNVI